MDTLLQDLRYALRTLAKSPGFTLVAVLTLALGIGANTAMFSVFYGVLLRPLPYAEPDRIVGLAQTFPGGRGVRNVTYVQFQFLQRHTTMLESVAAAASVGFNLADGSQADRVYGLRVSRNYFHVLGVQPALGRTFLEDEDQPNGPSAVILSHGLWQRRFGGDRNVIGQPILLDGAATTVVGVMPPAFRSPNGAEAWSTLAQVGRTVGGGSNLSIIGRLPPGETFAQARAAMARLTESFRTEFRSVSRDMTLDLDPYRVQITSDLRTPTRVLLAAIAFVLLIACANVASLMLGRAATRQQELAVRAALGATRARVLRQLLTESVLLGLIGGAIGLIVASWGVNALMALEPNALPGTTEIRLDRWALGFTFGLSLLTGLAFGTAPAWQATRVTSARVIGSTQRARIRNVLVVGEIALSQVLLVGAGLLIQTFARLIGTDPGFDPRRVVSAEFWLTGTRYDSTARIAGFYGDLTARLEALPGIQAAAVVEAGLPLEQGGNASVFVSDGKRLSIDYRSITPGYFRTLGVSVIAGRDFTAGDADGAAPVVIVNESFARRHLSGEAVLGRMVTVEGQPRQVVGMVRDVRSFVRWPAPPTVFIPSAQTPASLTKLFASWFPTHVVVRTHGDPDAAMGVLSRVIRETDALVPVGRARAMEEVLMGSLSFQRFLMALLTAFAALAITLASIGLYGVIAYGVTERTHEIGVRMALGARARDVLQLVLRRGVRLIALGVVLGLGGALGLTRFISGQLYGVHAIDPWTFAGVTALLAVVALLACWLPARRATRVDPMIALRTE